jgi:hypothetical protein
MQPAKHLMAIATVAAATLAGHPSVAVSGEAQVPCKDLTHRGAAYTVCRIDLRRHAIRLFWKSPDGQPYGSLMRLPKTSGASQSPLLFAANAGMFRPDYGPAGLYIENGRVLNRRGRQGGSGRNRRISEAEAQTRFCDAVRSDARNRRQAASALSRQQRLAEAPGRHRRPERPHCVLRPLETGSDFRRLRPPVPGPPQMLQRFVPGRRLGADTIFSRDKARSEYASPGANACGLSASPPIRRAELKENDQA